MPSGAELHYSEPHGDCRQCPVTAPIAFRTRAVASYVTKNCWGEQVGNFDRARLTVCLMGGLLANAGFAQSNASNNGEGDEDAAVAQAVDDHVGEMPTVNLKAAIAFAEARKAYDAENWSAADRAIRRAIENDPNEVEYHKFDGYIAAARNDHAGVLRAANAALKVDSEDAEAYEMRANANYFLGNKALSLDDYRLALRYDRLDAGFYRNYLHTLNELRRYDELMDVYAKYVQRRRDAPDELEAKADIPFYASLAFIARKDYMRAVTLLNESIALSPDYAGFYGNRGIAYDIMGKYGLALADFAKAIELAPKDGNYHFLRGVTWLHSEDYTLAMEAFTRANALGVDDSALWQNFGVVYERLGKQQQALDAYDRALKLDPENAAARANRATLLRDLGQSGRAARENEIAANGLAPEDVATIRVNEATAKMKDKDWTAALSMLEAAVRLRPEYDVAWVNMSAVLVNLDKPQQALKILNDVLARSPDQPLALANRGYLLRRLGDEPGSGTDYAHLTRIAPTNSSALQNYARHLDVTGDTTGARRYFELARVAFTPDAPEVYVNYSAFLLTHGDTRKALVIAREGAQKLPSNYGLQLNLGNALAEAGQPQDAVAAYKRAIALAPIRLDAYFNLGNQYALQMNDPAAGIAWYRDALKRQPDPELDRETRLNMITTVQLNLASALERSGDNTSAFKVLQEAIDGNPADYTAFFNRAGLKQRLNDIAGARRDYELALGRIQRIQATSAEDKNPAIAEHQAYALINTGRLKEGAGILERQLIKDPDNHGLRRNLAYTELDLAQTSNACDHFDRAFSADPGEVDGWLGLLVCAALKGDGVRLGTLKQQFGKRFKGRYTVSARLPQQLIAEGYSYSPSFLTLWDRVEAAN